MAALTPGVAMMPARRGRSSWAAPVIAFGVTALLAGLWGGLLRLGVPVPAGHAGLAELHGVLMPLGFLGTLIAAERAVALAQSWPWIGPAASGTGSLWLVGGGPVSSGQVMIAFAGFVLLAVYVEVHRIQPSWHNTTQAAGAACWCLAGVLWVAGNDVSLLVPWMAGFLVLTIAGERLELSRLVLLTARGRALFLAAVLLLLAGLALSVGVQTTGVRLAGAGLLGLAAWLATHDVVRRTIRMTGVTRYMAVALAAGYVWLAVAGALWLTGGHLSDGPAYDAMLHAVFLGFVFSMVFAHAPVIVPSVLRVRFPFHPISYLPLALLHVSLVVRLVGGDAMGNDRAWQVGGVLNEVAILLFLAITATTVTRALRTGRSAGQQHSEEQGGQRTDAGERAEHGEPGRAAGAGVQERGHSGEGDHQELHDQRGPVAAAVTVGLGRDVPHAGHHQDAERRPGHLVETPRGLRGHLSAEAAQRGDQRRQRELPAHPDGRGEHVEEEPDGVPGDRDHGR
jgi:hypothetical protein